jgi:hypothetical protein
MRRTFPRKVIGRSKVRIDPIAAVGRRRWAHISGQRRGLAENPASISTKRFLAPASPLQIVLHEARNITAFTAAYPDLAVEAARANVP